MREKAEVNPCRVHIYSLKGTSALWGNTKQEVGNALEGNFCDKSGTLLFLADSVLPQLWSLPEHQDKAAPCQWSYARLTSAVSLIEMSSSPARTSLLTPTLTMTKGRICLRISTEQAKSPKPVYEVSWVAETLVQQQLSHCSLWANKI